MTLARHISTAMHLVAAASFQEKARIAYETARHFGHRPNQTDATLASYRCHMALAAYCSASARFHLFAAMERKG